MIFGFHGLVIIDEIGLDPKATVVARWCASEEERKAALPPFRARTILAEIFCDSARGRAALLDAWEALEGHRPYDAYRTESSYFLDHLLKAVVEGKLLLVPGWPNYDGYAGAPRTKADSRSPERRLADKVMAKARGEDLSFEGARYVILPALSWPELREKPDCSLQVVRRETARATISRMAERAAPGDEKEALEKAATMLADTNTPLVKGGLFLLQRRAVRSFESEEAEPAITPSMLAQAQMKLKATPGAAAPAAKMQYSVRFLLKNPDGRPVASCPYEITGDTQPHKGSTDAQGRTENVVTEAPLDLGVRFGTEEDVPLKEDEPLWSTMDPHVRATTAEGDPTKEAILGTYDYVAVAGAAFVAKRSNSSYMVFVHQAIRQIQEYPAMNRWFILFADPAGKPEGGYSKQELAEIEKAVVAKGAKFVTVDSATHLALFLDTRDTRGCRPAARALHPIKRVDVFSHGMVGMISFGYAWHAPDAAVDLVQRYAFTAATARQLDPEAFSPSAEIYLWSCRGAMGNPNEVILPGQSSMIEKSLAQAIADRTKVKVFGFAKRSSYKESFSTTAEREAARKWLFRSEDDERIKQRIADSDHRRDTMYTKIGAKFDPEGAKHPVVSGDTPVGARDGLIEVTPGQTQY